MDQGKPSNQLDVLTEANQALQAEIAGGQKAEEELRLLLAVTRAVAEAQDFHSASKTALRHICEQTGWDYGEIWLPNVNEDVLQFGVAWHRENENLDRFRSYSESLTFAPGQGLPGRVWQDKQLRWLQDITIAPEEEFVRGEIAKKFNLKSALAVPVVGADKATAVLAFLMFESSPKDKPLIEMVSHVAAQLGGLMQRKRGEEVLRKARAELEMRVEERTSALRSEIAERKRAEGALRESEEQLRSTLQFSQAVMANMGEGLYALDAGGLVTYINPTAERLFGWSNAELLGRKMHDMTHYQHPDGTPFPADECPGLQVLQKGMVLADHDDVFIRKDGTFFPVIYSSAPIRSDGRTVGLVVVFRDVTARKDVERELERNASWLRNLVVTTQDAVLSIDRRGCVVLFNPSAERIFGYTADEIGGRKVNELMAEPYASEHDEYIARYERTGEARAIGRIRTVTAKRKNGELFPIELSVTEIEVDQEVHYAAFIRDISEKTKLQQQLVDSERLAAIGTTAAKIGHELANPLNGMSLTIQLLEQRLKQQAIPPDNQVTTTIKRLKDEISRLNQLAGQFRLISRRERYDFHLTALAGLIDDVVKIQRPHLAQLNIVIDQIIPADLPTISVDKDKIKQALLNLLKNAAEAMPGGGKITIEARAAEHGVLIEITDTGMGIPLDIDAFEPFVTTKKEGTGIGLVIVRQIVTAHGGNIFYRTEPGVGTTFRIELARESS